MKINCTSVILTSFVLVLFALSVSSLPTTTAYSGVAQVPSASSLKTSSSDSPPITKADCPDCFAGYYDSGPNGSVSSVSTYLIVPAVSCQGKGPAYSAFGVFAAGLGVGTNFEGAYVVAFCTRGEANYLATWFDNNIFTDCGPLCGVNATWSPARGDALYISLSYSIPSGEFTIIFNDITQGKVYTAKNAFANPILDFAGCSSDLLENTALAVQPSVKFSTAAFRECRVDGQPVGTAPNGTTVFEFTCTNASETKILAQPTHLTRNENFNVKFVARGP
jgi:hypothetical protein